jgi:hypothetical protein
MGRPHTAVIARAVRWRSRGCVPSRGLTCASGVPSVVPSRLRGVRALAGALTGVVFSAGTGARLLRFLVFVLARRLLLLLLLPLPFVVRIAPFTLVALILLPFLFRLLSSLPLIVALVFALVRERPWSVAASVAASAGGGGAGRRHSLPLVLLLLRGGRHPGCLRARRRRRSKRARSNCRCRRRMLLRLRWRVRVTQYGSAVAVQAVARAPLLSLT